MKANEPKFKWSIYKNTREPNSSVIGCQFFDCPYSIKVYHGDLDHKRRPLVLIVNTHEDRIRFKSRSIAAMKLTMRKLYYYEKSKGLI